MGVFRSVQMDLSCQRCGTTYHAEVQFKTGRDWCEAYAVGDRVEDLPAGEEWEGIADRFCAPCSVDHQAERERAMATVLAQRVRAGQLVLKLADVEAPLTPEGILLRGAEQAEAARRDRTLYGLTKVLTDLRVLDLGRAWPPSAKPWESWWPPLRRALDLEMRRLGWAAGDELFREDLVVDLDQERRIHVRVLEAGR